MSSVEANGVWVKEDIFVETPGKAGNKRLSPAFLELAHRAVQEPLAESKSLVTPKPRRRPRRKNCKKCDVPVLQPAVDQVEPVQVATAKVKAQRYIWWLTKNDQCLLLAETEKLSPRLGIALNRMKKQKGTGFVVYNTTLKKYPNAEESYSGIVVEEEEKTTLLALEIGKFSKL